LNPLAWGEYIDDWKWNLRYVKDWKIISTLTWLWKSIVQSRKDNYEYKIYENNDWSFTSFTIDKENNKISTQTFNIEWDIPWGYISTVWSGVITSYGWLHDWGQWLDIDWKIGDQILAPMWGTVVKVQDMWSEWYGKTVLVELNDGNFIRFSHLNDFAVDEWDVFAKWGLIWLMWNTGYTIPTWGGDWSHVDIVMSDTDWRRFNAYEVKDYLDSVWNPKSDISDLDNSKELKTIQIGKEAYGKNISDAEWARIEKILSDYPNATAREIIIRVRGLNGLTTPQVDEALTYVRAVDKITTPPDRYESSIADYISRWDKQWLKQYMIAAIDNDIRKNNPDEFVSTSGYKSQAELTQKVINLVNKNRGKIWAIPWRITDLKKIFVDVWDYQELQSSMTWLLAQLRKNFAGSAVTQSELDALADYVSWKTTENPYNLITKLSSLHDKSTTDYWNQRIKYQTPITKYKLVMPDNQKTDNKSLDFLNAD
jgi:hypothetical protein